MSGLGEVGAAARRTALIGSAFAIAGAVAYGLNVIGARLCAGAGVRGSDIVVYRALMFLPLLALLLVIRRQSPVLSVDDRPMTLRFGAASVGTALFYLSSLAYLPVPVAVTIFYTYPLVVIAVTPLLDRVRLPLRRWLVALVAFAGVLLAVGPGAEALDPRGVGLALCGSLCSAAMFISGARVNSDPVITFFWSQMIALPLGLGFAWMSGGLTEPQQLLAAAGPLALNVAGYFLGFLLMILAASRISAATSGLLFLFEPVVTIVAAALLLGETVSLTQGLGMALIIGALILDQLPNLRPAPSTSMFDP